MLFLFNKKTPGATRRSIDFFNSNYLGYGALTNFSALGIVADLGYGRTTVAHLTDTNISVDSIATGQ